MVLLVTFAVCALLSGPVAAVVAFVALRRVSVLERKVKEIRTLTRSAEQAHELQKNVAATDEGGVPPLPTPAPHMPLIADGSDVSGKADGATVTFDSEGETLATDNEARLTDPAEPRDASVSPPSPEAWSWREVEEAIGTRWAVWLGGIAIAIGGALLVRQISQAGLLGPGVRILAGYALAVVTGLGAERLRVVDRVDSQQRWPGIPAVLTGSALMVAFATTYAAYGLYGFIGAGPALVALGALGLAALALSKRYGQPMAGLGLVGAMGAPLLLGNGEGIGAALAVYLPIVAAAGYLVSIARRWSRAALATATASLTWVVGLYVFSASPIAAEGNLLAQAVLGLLSLDGMTVREMLPATVGRRRAAAIASAAIAVMAATVLYQTSALPNAAWPLIGLTLVVALLVHGSRRAPLSPSAVAATAVATAMTACWPVHGTWSDAEAAFATFNRPGSAAGIQPVWPWAFMGFASAVPLMILCVSTALLTRSRGLRRIDATVYATAGAAAPALSIVAVQANAACAASFSSAPGIGLDWSVFGLVSAMACGVSVRTLLGLPAMEVHARGTAAGIMVAGAATSVALAAWVGLSGTTLTIALSAAACASALVDRRWRVPELRWYVGALAMWVAGRIGTDPLGNAYAYGLPVWSGIAVAFGFPACAFALAGRWLSTGSRREDPPALACKALALLLSATLAFLEVHQAAHGGALLAPVAGLAEAGLASVVAAGYAAMLASHAGSTSLIRRGAYLVALCVSLFLALVGTLVLGNPAISGDPVQGGVLFNDIALGYALPAAALFALGYMARRGGSGLGALMARATGTVLIFFYATFSIRFWFHGSRIGLWWGAIEQAETLCYSLAWLAIGLGIMVYGIVRRSLQARVASAGFVIASVMKVFLVDLAGQEGLGRAASFIMLGAVLIGIGLLYQKVVFAKPAGSGPT